MEAMEVLVVDDDPSVRISLEEMLRRDGYQVQTAATGQQALQQIAQKEFDLILLDLMLKKMSGLEILAHLQEEHPQVVAIILTGHASLETAVKALRQGAHDYLFKPCQTDELRDSIRRAIKKRRVLLQQQNKMETLENIQALLSQGSEAGPPRAAQSDPTTSSPDKSERFLQRGPIIIDSSRHVVTIDGHLLTLSPTEFDLFSYLVTEAPRVLTGQELVEYAQGYEMDESEARDITSYHIYRIRRKIKKVWSGPDPIKTVRGVGYALAFEEQ